MISSNFNYVILMSTPDTRSRTTSNKILKNDLLDNNVHTKLENWFNSITRSTNNTYLSHLNNINTTATNEEPNIPRGRISSMPCLLGQTSSIKITGWYYLHNLTAPQISQLYSYYQFYRWVQQQAIESINKLIWK